MARNLEFRCRVLRVLAPDQRRPNPYPSNDIGLHRPSLFSFKKNADIALPQTKRNPTEKAACVLLP